MQHDSTESKKKKSKQKKSSLPVPRKLQQERKKNLHNTNKILTTIYTMPAQLVNPQLTEVWAPHKWQVPLNDNGEPVNAPAEVSHNY